MVRILLCLAFVFVVNSAAEAAPRWRRQPTYSQPAQSQRVYGYTSNYSSGNTSTAQGVAEMMASRGVMQHFGGNSGYEGVGMGSSPEDALSRCCYSSSGMTVVDQGVACGANGRWYACKRYR